MKIKLIFSLFALLVSNTYPNEFTVPARKKSSFNRLREQCCHSCSQILKGIPHTLRAQTKRHNPQLLSFVADLQEACLAAIEGYIEGSQKGFIMIGSKEALEKGLGNLQQLSALLNEGLSAQLKEARELLCFLDQGSNLKKEPSNHQGAQVQNFH